MSNVSEVGDSSTTPEPTNPLQGLKGLEELSLTGFTPAVSRPRQRLQPRAIQEAMWEHARGSDAVQRVQVDKILGAQEVESGGFKAHEVPMGLLTTSKMVDSDNSMRSAQQQQCALGLLLAKSLANVDDIVRKVREATAEGQGLSLEESRDLATELSDEATRPLAQAFRIIASKANDLHMRRRDRIVDNLRGQDEVLANVVKQAPLGHQAFFKDDLSDHIKEATNRASWRSMMRASQPRHSRESRAHPYTRPADSRRPQHGKGEHKHTPRRDQQPSRPFHGGRPGHSGRGRQASKGKGPSFKGQGKQTHDQDQE